MSLHYHLIASPWGPLGLIRQDSPPPLRRVYLPMADEAALLRRIHGDWGTDIDRAEERTPAALEPVIDALADNYWNGTPIEPPYALLDWTGVTDLQRAVLTAVAAIPFGEVRSYGEIAAAVGRPKSARFVGNTMARNPFPLLIPCHRVVRADRSVGGFGGGPEMKRRLIEMETGIGDNQG